MTEHLIGTKLMARFPSAEFFWPQFVDLRGVAMGRLIPISDRALQEACEKGTGFGGAAMVGMGQGPHDPALMAVIDPESGLCLPWNEKVVRFTCSLNHGGSMYSGCPRNTLIKVLDRAKKIGFHFTVGVELEHFLVRKTSTGGIVPWDLGSIEEGGKLSFTVRATTPAVGYLTDVLTSIKKLDWVPLAGEKEEGPGQFEINLMHDDALTTADKYVFLRHLVSYHAERHGAIATFMAKPFPDRTGSGLHLHFNLSDEKGLNLFADQSDSMGLSRLAYSFIGGVLSHAKALCAFTNPTVNCYKRLVGGNALTGTLSGNTWTPAGICFGGNNRTVMIRVVDNHCEDRSVSPSCNPYLAFAAYLSAGLDGIERGLRPGNAAVGNLYSRSPDEMTSEGIQMLPKNLREATDILNEDEFFHTKLGPVTGELIKWQRQQWDTFHSQITSLELAEGLQLY